MGARTGGIPRREAAAALLRNHRRRREGARGRPGTGSRARRNAFADAEGGEMRPAAVLRHVVRAAALLVPRWRRRDWTREWTAELEAEAGGSGASRSRLVDRS